MAPTRIRNDLRRLVSLSVPHIYIVGLQGYERGLSHGYGNERLTRVILVR